MNSDIHENWMEATNRNMGTVGLGSGPTPNTQEIQVIGEYMRVGAGTHRFECMSEMEQLMPHKNMA